MTSRATFSVFCDSIELDALTNGCYGWIGNEDSVSDARRAARRAHWKRRRKGSRLLDLCAPCDAKLVRLGR